MYIPDEEVKWSAWHFIVMVIVAMLLALGMSVNTSERSSVIDKLEKAYKVDNVIVRASTLEGCPIDMQSDRTVYLYSFLAENGQTVTGLACFGPKGRFTYSEE